VSANKGCTGEFEGKGEREKREQVRVAAGLDMQSVQVDNQRCSILIPFPTAWQIKKSYIWGADTRPKVENKCKVLPCCQSHSRMANMKVKGKALPQVLDQAVGVPICPIPDCAVAYTMYARIK